jgi:hypothetical protein
MIKSLTRADAARGLRWELYSGVAVELISRGGGESYVNCGGGGGESYVNSILMGTF